ncbi:MAG TPA: hypothetical protein PLW86_18610 [Rhodocyclaceae bacterium]|nr:hypothetical protein [Rhodocyclaceae bacterium]
MIAWLWARTVKSPNPAFSHVDVPLASTFILSSKVGKERYVQPVIKGDSYCFEIRTGKPPESAKEGTKAAGRGATFLCLLSGTPISGDYIKAEGKAGCMGIRLMAVVVEGKRSRIYLAPTADFEAIACMAAPKWRPELEFAKNSRHLTPWVYGFTSFGDLFTRRQLITLAAFSDLVQETRNKVKVDAINTGWTDDGQGLASGGAGVTAYADAVAVYLAFAIDRMAMTGNTLVRWNNVGEKAQHCFGRQALPMLWDFAEPNFMGTATGSLDAAVFYASDPVAFLPTETNGIVNHSDAQQQSISKSKVVSTDPPYYDNVPYADLSDFFYVWLRRTLRHIFPDLFSTIGVPKAEELVADSLRHIDNIHAEQFFLHGMTEAMHRLAKQTHPAFPTTIYYAFKQSDTTNAGTGNTGWETFLEAVLRAGFCLTGTWPLRTEMKTRQRAMDSNALASSIVLVCRQRAANAPSISRRDFLRELKEELADAVDVMIGGTEGLSPVAPVDLAQAVIGPGMAIFSKHSAVLEADGSPMTVHSALVAINRMLIEGGDDFDSDTQFCLSWFDQLGWVAGEFGQADVLARAKGTSVDGVRDAGVVEAGSGKVRLLKPAEYPADWNPKEDNRTPIWEALHQMIRALQSQSESAAGALLAHMPERAEPIRNLAYRLYTLCERKGWTDEARGYNELITSWLGIEAASHDAGQIGSQAKLDI